MVLWACMSVELDGERGLEEVGRELRVLVGSVGCKRICWLEKKT